ncbi:hypothetical protein MAR_020261 [Mya arenaria]|uniref:Uncharacterized protein n=1 Tax=Mya arenaria TaxID=6604 RepID=A0ABY7E7G6_MYAAR|nr:hypothetical protein MAR_020261 [Mya arenaria]
MEYQQNGTRNIAIQLNMTL